MTSLSARAVPWQAVVQFHREVARRAEQTYFALPVTAAGAERWSPLTGFEPEGFEGPWVIEPAVLESAHLRRDASTGTAEAFVGGPCWYRLVGEQRRGLEWIPLIYREVAIQVQDERLHMVPADSGWRVCPLVHQFIQQRNIGTAAPLDEMLPDLLAEAESRAAEDPGGVTSLLIDGVRARVPELGHVLDKARKELPVEGLASAPSPWVLFSVTAGGAAAARNIGRDFDRLEHHLGTAPHNVGGLRLLEDTSGGTPRAVSEIASVVTLNERQRAAVEATLAGRPVTVISGPPDTDREDVILSILMNAWAGSMSVLLASQDQPAADAVRERLKTFESELDIAIGADGGQLDRIIEGLGRTRDLLAARRGESHYGGSPIARKRSQLVQKKELMRQMLASEVPQRVSRSMQAALASYAARSEAIAALESGREDLAAGLRDLGVGAEPDTFEERILTPLREWRGEIDATRRLIERDTQRDAALREELSVARAERGAVLASCELDADSSETSWLLDEPGFESFDRALVALAEKLRDPIQDDPAEAAWEPAYDAWSSSEQAAGWERKARELAALIRPAGIALKEKSEEVRAAHEALDAAKRNVQEATHTANLDVRGEDLDEWAACYAELCSSTPSKLAFLARSKNADLVERLEKMERRFRSSFPPHLWTSIGKLDETGRARLAPVIERAREWVGARDDWDRLSPVREEIEAETDALRHKLDELGMGELSTEVTPAACGAVASKLNSRASEAASAAAAWSRRERKERLPEEVTQLAAQIRNAGAGTPIKARWTKRAGAPLMTALDAVAGDPGAQSLEAVRREILDLASVDPVRQDWRRAYEAEKQITDVSEQLERIPSRAARLARWKSLRPTSLPATLELEGAFDGDESHPVWTFLNTCDDWSRRWAAFQNEDAAAFERTAETEGAAAIRHMTEAAQALPQGRERAWLEAFANASKSGNVWPVDEIREKAALWRAERLQAEVDRIDAKLERIAFETVKEQWLERATRGAEVLGALDALREHYESHPQGIEEEGYVHFERSLGAQPVWIATPLSAQFIPMQQELFDVLIIDEAKTCSLTSMLPLLFRAKRLVVVGDPGQSPRPDSIGTQAERTLAGRFGIESWIELFGHVGNDAYKSAIGNLPGRRVEMIALTESA